MAEQIVFRAVGVFAVYLIGLGASLSRPRAMILATLLTLGATVSGPSVLVVEYEPVPRGFALPFLLLSLGLLMNERWSGASYAAGVAFLLHPPTALVYCGLLGILVLWQRKWKSVIILIVSVQILAVLAVLQPDRAQSQPLFSLLTPGLEQLQRMRAAYNWVSTWIGRFGLHYAVVFVFSAIAYWRIYRLITKKARIVFAFLPLVGILSIPASFALLEGLKWSFGSQFQPGRYVLYLPMFAMLMGGIAGLRAGGAGRYAEAIAFLLFPFLLTMNPNIFEAAARDVLVAVLLAAIAVLCSRYEKTFAVACLAPFVLIPMIARTQNYSPLHSAELNQLASWAERETDKDAIFQFSGFGRDLQQGVFRSRAKRALYVDWKAGGQINFLPDFAEIWRARWERVQQQLPLSEYTRLGIDYVITKVPLEGETPVFQNGKFYVYYVRRGRGAMTASTSDRLGMDAWAPMRVTEIAAAALANRKASSIN
jgi:hypothetical protein